MGASPRVHDAINLQVLRQIARQSEMVTSMEVEDLFIGKMSESAIMTEKIMPLLTKHLKGYVPDGSQTGIADNKHAAGVDQFSEVKVISNGTI